MKKVLAFILCLAMALSMVGCGFQVGTPSNSESFEELFPDRAAEDGKVYTHKNMAYDFSLDGYGKMRVHVDVSDGQAFDLKSENAGFNINDKDGNPLVYAGCCSKESYQALTADVTETKKVNGREFFYRKNGDGSTDLFTYLADCGIDCGMVLETKGDESAFALVAFRGEPLEGSTSDLWAYKGTPAVEPEVVVDETPADNKVDNPDSTGETCVPTGGTDVTISTISPEAEEALASLQSDYNKVLWGVKYNLFEDAPYFIVSITPYTSYDIPYLEIAITNLYDEAVDFNGSAVALDAEGNEIADLFVWEDAIGAGSTVIENLACNGIPDGRLRWDDCNLSISEYREFVPWEADWAAVGDPKSGVFSVNYELYASAEDPKDMDSGLITFLALDENGFVLGVTTDFFFEMVPAGDKHAGVVTFYGDGDVLANTKSIAMFANPIVAK